jgi:hypothetical protein
VRALSGHVAIARPFCFRRFVRDRPVAPRGNEMRIEAPFLALVDLDLRRAAKKNPQSRR